MEINKGSPKFATFTALATGVLALSLPGVAAAQYSSSTVPNVYTSIPNPTVLTTDADDSTYTVTSSFPIRFYSNSYTDMRVGSNGAIYFGTTDSVSLSNSTPGSTSTPNNWIGPFWDDQRLYAANSGYIGYEEFGTAPNRELVVEWYNLSRYGSTGSTFSMSVHFYESGSIAMAVDYGPINGTATFSATMGMEDANGANEVFFHPSSCTTSCNQSNYADMVDSRVEIGFINPELSGTVDAVPGSLLGGETGNVQVSLENFGRNTAVGVVNRLFLSTDTTLDAADPLIGTFAATMPQGVTTVTTTITMPNPVAPAYYYVIMSVDAPDTYPEASEADNTVIGPRIATGTDFLVTDLSVPYGAAPGSQFDVVTTVSAYGPAYNGGASYHIVLSADTTLDAGDTDLGTYALSFTGQPFIADTQSVTLPAALPTGTYYVIAEVDPTDAIVELDEANNTTVSTGISNAVDFVATAVTVPIGIAPGANGDIDVTIGSTGVAYTGALPFKLWASTDDVLDANDYDLGTYSVQFAGESSIASTQTITLPTHQMLPAGNYYAILEIDPAATISELSTSNNTVASPSTFYNASEFLAENATAGPNALELGDIIHVTADVRNIGLPYTGNVGFGVYLSLDDIWDPGDQLIYDGLTFFPGTIDGIPVSVDVPVRALPGDPQLQPGAYTVIVRIDSDDLHGEPDEVNNAAAGDLVTIEGADLLPISISGPAIAFIGSPFQIDISIENQGVADANGLTYSFFLSTNDIIRVNDERIFTSATATIASGATGSFSDMVTVSSLTSTACMWVGVIVNDNGGVPETNINNNTRRIVDCIEFIFPVPDMTARFINTPTVAAAGEEFAVTRLLMNEGTADAPSFNYTYYLSDNPTISTDDVPLGTFSAAVPQGSDDYGIDVLEVPSQLANGDYYLGMIIDPDGLVAEVHEDNNVVLGPQIPVYGAAIIFETEALPNGTVGVDYNFGVYATGAPIALTWSVSRGSLPDGLTIDSASGIISGQPTQEGLFEFVLRASAGTAFAEKPFSVRVVAPSVDLRVASAALPTAVAGRNYSTQLVGVGGQVPYTWTTDSELPTGITLAESGSLSGTPSTPGTFPVSIRVTDTLGNTDTKDLILRVITANQSLQIVQIPLPTASVGVEFCDPSPVPFEAQNGTEPYVWSLIGSAPAGMALDSDGNLCGAPDMVGSFPFTVRVQDATGLVDTALFILEVSGGNTLTITTTNLDPGAADVAYSATLEATRGTEPYTWSIVDGTGSLPAGLTMSSEGVISGTPTEGGSFAFVALVTDAQQRIDTQPLGLYVEPKVIVDDTGDGGCTCVSDEGEDQPWTSMAALLGIGGLLLVRRRRRGLLGLLGLGAVMVSAPAIAQVEVPGTGYYRSEQAITYTPLANPTVITSDADDTRFDVTLPFPFEFYDNSYTTLTVSTNGIFGFPNTTAGLSPQVPGTATTPNNWVAMWWDDLRLYAANAGHLGTEVAGTAPNRTFTIEWHNISKYGQTSSLFSMRAVLYEGISGRIDVEYAPMTGATGFGAAAGMEDAAGARPVDFAGCGATCNETNYASTLAGRQISVTKDPGVELLAQGIDTPEFAFLGAETPVVTHLVNPHRNAIGPFEVTIEAADNAAMTGAVALGSTTVTVPGFTNMDVVVPAVIAPSFGETNIWMQVVVDSTNVIAEGNETNNVAVGATPTRLLVGAPDVAVASVRTSATQIQAGDTIDVYSIIRNVGGEVATDTEFVVMLSTNPVISNRDVQLDTWTQTLQPTETFTSTRTVTIPAGANSGIYYLGVLADPSDTIVELNESNNGRASVYSVVVTGDALAVTTSALPGALVDVAYEAFLSANGAAPPFTWEISSGNLPAGIRLLPTTGQLTGVPTAEETQSFTVRATSSDGQEATAQLSIAVSVPGLPLTIVTRSIPTAQVGQEYSFGLVATGMAEGDTLTWSLTGAPDGFEIDADGVITGLPSLPGTSTIEVSVTNGTATSTRELTLEVRPDDNLLIAPVAPPDAVLGMAYSHQFEATGGVAPLTWLIGQGSLPDGITLTPGGSLSGTPTTVGEYRFTVEVLDGATGGYPARDSNTFSLTVASDGTFTVDTPALADGTVGESYSETITASGGLPPYIFELDGDLPDGLLANPDPTVNGLILIGQPTAEGDTTLLVKVEDAQGRTTQRVFVLHVKPAPVIDTTTDDGGCRCVEAPMGSASWLAFGLIGLALLRRRR